MDGNYFIYLALGDEKYKKEAIYSVISLYRACKKEYRIVIYTDDVEYLSKYLGKEGALLDYIDFIEIGHDLFQKWTRDGKFMIGAKVSAIKHFCDNYNGKLIFLDTDTVILDDITKYFEQLEDVYLLNFERNNVEESLKHVNDFSTPAYLTTIKLLEGFMYGHNSVKVDNVWSPYNSGIIGMKTDPILLQSVADCTETIFKIAEYSTSEELAFSYLLQATGKVHELKNEVIHYFVKKETRLIVGHCLGVLLDEDQKLLQEKLKEANIDSIEKYQVILSQSEMFLNYLDYFKLKQPAYLWDTPRAMFYSKTEDLVKQKKQNLKMYRYWYSLEKRPNKKNTEKINLGTSY